MKTIFPLLALPLLLLSADFTLFSNNFGGQMQIEQVLDRFGCHGKNRSPKLHWKNAPHNTKSFAITLYDPDAPTGSGWWHWIVINIPASTNTIEENASANKLLPKGAVEIANDFGIQGYSGACPPKNDKPHKYILTLYALDVPKLKIPKGSTNAFVRYLINQHTITKTSLIAYYQRR